MKTAAWVLAALGLALGGCCAAFRGGKLERIAPWPPGPPPAPEKMKSVTIAFEGTAFEDGRQVPVDARSRVVYRNATHWAYYWSGRFSHVRPAPAPSDLYAEVRLVERLERSPVLVRVLAGLTLGLVPSSERRELTVATTVFDQNRKELGRFEKSEAVVTWWHVLLLPVFPFAPPPGVAANTVLDLSRATIVQAYTQGIY